MISVRLPDAIAVRVRNYKGRVHRARSAPVRQLHPSQAYSRARMCGAHYSRLACLKRRAADVMSLLLGRSLLFQDLQRARLEQDVKFHTTCNVKDTSENALQRADCGAQQLVVSAVVCF